MAGTRPPDGNETVMLPMLTTERVRLVRMAPGHGAMLAAFFRRNDRHLAPWDPPRPTGITEAAYWESECERAAEDFDSGAVVRWLMLPREQSQPLIGRINFTQIVRGPFQSCMLGYAIDAAHEGRGLMREALEAAIAVMFTSLGLHRIQANYVVDNARSGGLLARLGFVREGLARNYLFINGAWRDHVLTARLNTDFDASIFAAKRVTRSAPA
jgi:[ribosomal protein S5]-alanine N-acetyltransferase